MNQYIGIDLVPRATEYPGLLVNQNYLAEAALMAAVWAFHYNRWFLLPLAPALLIPLAKGPLLVGAVLLTGWVWGKSKPVALLCALLAVGGLLTLVEFDPLGSEGARLQMALNTLAMISPWGNGAGSFWSTYPAFHNAVVDTLVSGYTMINHPKSAHNDFLTVVSELGAVGVILFGFLVWLAMAESRLKYVLLSFLGAGLFAHPLLVPSSAAIAAIVAARKL